MKKILLTTVIFVFLLFISIGIQAQSTQTKLNQVELMKQWIGTWQTNADKDTVWTWEVKPYGKALIGSVTYDVKGKKYDSFILNFGYDDRDDKIKGFNLWPNTDFLTWIGVFKTEKKFYVNALDTFKPEEIWFKNEVEFITPHEMLIINLDSKGVKTGELIYKKVK
jgi:hypothetical protein